MRTITIFALVLLGLANSAATAAVNCSHKFPVGNSYVPYCSNDKHGPAVFVIHGTNRNADDYLSYLEDFDTLVIAPHFQDAGPGLYWSSGGWKRGDLSKDSARVSSFEVVDRMMEMFHGVAIVGHSAGGQFVNRYSAGTRLQGLTFIVANPSSYMYLDSTRPFGSASACPDFNEYKYGLEDPNSYMSAGASRDFPDRDVLYLLGSEDTKVDQYLDTSCEANRQGPNRYERGLRYFDHLARHFGRPVHRFAVVQGVGHSSSRMIKAARPYLSAALSAQQTPAIVGPTTVVVTEPTAEGRQQSAAPSGSAEDSTSTGDSEPVAPSVQQTTSSEPDTTVGTAPTVKPEPRRQRLRYSFRWLFQRN